MEISNLASLALALAAVPLAGRWGWAPAVSLVFAAASLSATLGLCVATDVLFRRIPTPAARSLAICGLSASVSIVLLALQADAGQIAASGTVHVTASGDAGLAGDALVLGIARSLGGAFVMGGVGIAGAALGKALPSGFGTRGAASPSCATPPVGGGDIRLMIALGAFCGPAASLALLVACVLACAYCLTTRSVSAPFGPCLALPGLALFLAQAVSVL